MSFLWYKLQHKCATVLNSITQGEARYDCLRLCDVQARIGDSELHHMHRLPSMHLGEGHGITMRQITLLLQPYEARQQSDSGEDKLWPWMCLHQ